MGTAIIIIIIACIIGAFIGGAEGALAGGQMAGIFLLYIFISGVSILIILWLFSAIFG